jgi:phosphoglycerate kinase
MALKVKRMGDVDLADKRVLIREDFNVPLKGGHVTSDTRIQAALPTIELALARGARVAVMSHLGRPTEGRHDPELSLAPVAARLGALLGRRVPLVEQWLDGFAMQRGQVVLCENVRFLPGEKKNDPALAKRMAQLCDVFVMDAFATAHRAEASTCGVAEYAPVACAGPLLVAELEALERALAAPERPVVAVVGGSKVSTKLQVLQSLASKVDQLLVGGGIANTLLAASGAPIGRSLAEADMNDFSRRLLAGEFGFAEIPLPIDVVVARGLDDGARGAVKPVGEVAADEMILDVGPRTAALYAERLHAAATIIWNGPVGVFEHPEFAAGTRAIAQAIAASRGFSIAGGGDTLAAIEQFEIGERVSYISTGGGAFLEFMEGRTLPAVAMLESRA